jgi:ribonuclease P protein component
VHADAAPPTRPRLSLGREQRLRRPQEFAAVLDARRSVSLRAAGEWLSMSAAWSTAAGARRVRLGITVGKRMARRSLDRALVKRQVREAFRHAAPALDRAALRAGAAVDVSLRLKSPLGTPGSARRPGLTALRRALRADADGLLLALATRLSTLEPHA